jgi:hypothetical protein
MYSSKSTLKYHPEVKPPEFKYVFNAKEPYNSKPHARTPSFKY